MAGWQRNFLQTGMQGSAIVFGNGKLPLGTPIVPPPRTEIPERVVVVATGTNPNDLRNALKKQVDTQLFKEQYKVLREVCPPFIKEKVLLNRTGLATLGESLVQASFENPDDSEEATTSSGPGNATEDAVEKDEHEPVATWVSVVEESVGMQDRSGVAAVWATIAEKFSDAQRESARIQACEAEV